MLVSTGSRGGIVSCYDVIRQPNSLSTRGNIQHVENLFIVGDTKCDAHHYS
jgi:hypothetical protein